MLWYHLISTHTLGIIMRIKSLLLASCLSLGSLGYAEHNHSYPQTTQAAAKSDLKKGASYPGYCAIEVVNFSNGKIWVYGSFEDNTPLESFEIPRNDSPHVIHLDNYDRRYGYAFCHNSMYIYILDWWGHTLYAGYTNVGSIVEVHPSINNQLKVEIKKK